MRNKSAMKKRPNNIGPWYEALTAEQRSALQQHATRAQWGHAEISAVEDGLTAYEQLLAKLADVPTPAGPTPRQLGREHLVQLQLGEQPARSNHR